MEVYEFSVEFDYLFRVKFYDYFSFLYVFFGNVKDYLKKIVIVWIRDIDVLLFSYFKLGR